MVISDALLTLRKVIKESDKGMKYLVYENWTVRPDKARLHEATCGHANK